MCVLNSKCQNYYISKMVYSILKIGYINFGISVNSDLSVNFQSSAETLISSFFCNLFLHEFDLFIMYLMNQMVSASNLMSFNLLKDKFNNINFIFFKNQLYYVRYGDDFLLGFRGPKNNLERILILINHFLELFLGMRLNVYKTKLKYSEKGIYFLGYKI